MKKIPLYHILAIMLTCSMICRAQWVRTNGLTGYSVSSLGVSGEAVFAGTHHGVFRTTNNGGDWTAINAGLTDTTVLSFAFAPSVSGAPYCFAGTGGGVFGSMHPGDPWTPMNIGLPAGNVNALAAFPYAAGDSMEIFAGVYDFLNGGGIYRSTDNGAHWHPAMTGLTHFDVRSFTRMQSIDGPVLFAATYGGGVFRSSDSGEHWSAAGTGLTTLNIAALASCEGVGRLFAATNGGGIFRSADLGLHWNAVNDGLTNVIINALIVCSAGVNGDSVRLAAGSGWSGIFVSSNSGTVWSLANDGLTTTQINALMLSTDRRTLFAGTDDGVWRRPMSELLTGVLREADNAPTQYRLEQNYPNPFNLSTIIRFQLPAGGMTTLSIFDAVGREAATLVNEVKEAGTYSASFEGSDLSSGIYFARLSANGRVQIRRLVLMK
ncbi:MAG: T9SS type A sorting domain-containing protein [Bacteroidetes bacterium]|nr:T9SS type A sorting domain-containing protein [Bacteroidota bacterium]